MRCVSSLLDDTSSNMASSVLARLRRAKGGSPKLAVCDWGRTAKREPFDLKLLAFWKHFRCVTYVRLSSLTLVVRSGWKA